MSNRQSNRSNQRPRNNQRSRRGRGNNRQGKPVGVTKISGGTKPPMIGATGGSMAEKIKMQALNAQQAQQKQVKRDPARGERRQQVQRPPKAVQPPRQKNPNPARPPNMRQPMQQQRGPPQYQQTPPRHMAQPPIRKQAPFNPQTLLRTGEVFGKVRKVLSGDTITIEITKQQGAAEREFRNVSINDILAPRISRSERQETDALFAWESREFLRKHLIHNIVIVKLNPQESQPKNNAFKREFGQVWFRPNAQGPLGPNRDEWKDVAVFSIANGMSEVKSKADGENADKLREIEKAARAGLVGKHEPRPVNVSENDKSWFRMHHREVEWSPDQKQLFNQHKGQKLSAIVEDVREGSCVRCELIMSDQRGIKTKLIWLELSGIECPRMPKPVSVQKREADKAGRQFTKAPVPQFAQKAQMETMIRLLHREVEVIIESIDAFDNLYGSVVFHRGDIGQYLLTNGYARVVPWTCQRLEEYRAIERQARTTERNIWSLEEYKQLPVLGEVEHGVVMEITSGDCIMVEGQDGKMRRLFLASVQAPRRNGPSKKPEAYYFEAKEHVRKALIRKTISFELEYTRKAGKKDKADRFEYVTVVYDGNRNLNTELVKMGYATVVEHRKGEPRSQNYQQLMDMQYIATRTEVGIHNPQQVSRKKLEDFTNVPRTRRRRNKDKDDSEKAKEIAKEIEQRYNHAKAWAKQNLGLDPEAQRRSRREQGRRNRDRKGQDGGDKESMSSKPPTSTPKPMRVKAVCEYVFSADRIKVRLEEQNAFLNLILTGIDMKNVDKALADSATANVRQMITQQEVEIEVERIDRKANFIGNLYTPDGRDLSVYLLSNGWAQVFKPKNPSMVVKIRQSLKSAEESAKEQQLGCWEDWTPPLPPPPEEKKETSEEQPAQGDDQQPQQGGRSQGGPRENRRERGRRERPDREKRERPQRVKKLKVEVTQLIDAVTFYSRNINDKLAEKIEPALAAINPSTVEWNDKFVVSHGKVVAGLFSDGNYYRCRISGNSRADEDGTKNFRCVWIDFGETGMIKESQVLEIADSSIRDAPPLALKMVLAGVKPPPENSVYFDQSTNRFWHEIHNKQLNVEILRQNRDTRFVIVKIDGESLNDKLVLDGVLRTQTGRGMRETPEYKAHLMALEAQSKEMHNNMWEYGDLGSDDEDEDRKGGKGGRRGRDRD